MKVSRGDIVMADFPFASGGPGKLRPVLVMQADVYNRLIQNALVVMLTTNLRNAGDQSHFLIDVFDYRWSADRCPGLYCFGPAGLEMLSSLTLRVREEGAPAAIAVPLTPGARLRRCC